MHRARGDEEDVATVLDARAERGLAHRGFVLTVVQGPDRGASVVVDEATPGRVLVGKGPACGLRLTDPKVSRRHFAIDAHEGRIRLVDLESTNGTQVGSLVVRDALLSGDERVGVGDSVILVDRTASAAVEAGGNHFGSVVGESSAMRRLYPLCRRLAATDVPLLIEGETGTGKEVLAESIHAASPRVEGPFVVCDCTAMAPSLVESAIFGHEKGSFTGATGMQRGFFEQAHGGTLLLDEIGDLELALQSKLLRAIERSEIRRVGADRWLKVDVRVIAATRRDLDHEIEAGRFRDDLFYRLAIARIELPPLRERSGDVTVLAAHFWKALASKLPASTGESVAPMPRDLAPKLEAYGWPGNVRELRNAIARRIALGDLAGELPQGGAGAVRGAPTAAAMQVNDFVEHVLSLGLPLTEARDLLVEDFERRYIDRMLRTHEGDATRAAAAAGVARRYFQLLRAKRT